MHEILAKFTRQLRLRNYSPRTIKTYSYHVARYCRFLNCEPRYAKQEHIEDWLLRLSEKHAATSVNLAAQAVKSFYLFQYGRRLHPLIPNMKEPKQLPKLLSREEIKAMIDSTTNKKQKLLLVLIYSTGLRLSEIRALKHKHLFPERAYGIVKGGKGAKDRLFHLSPALVKMIPAGEGCLFPGRRGPYSVKSIQMIVKNAAKRAGINRNVTPHMLRHSYATHLLEQGVDIRLIQELLGHASPRRISTHVAANSFQGLPV